MASTGVRLTLKFNFQQQIRAAGWSESYDMGWGSIPSALLNISRINAFINDRLFCLGSGPILVEALLAAYVQPLLPGAAPVRRATVSIPIPSPPVLGLAYNPNFINLLNPTLFVADFAATVFYINLVTDPGVTPVYQRSVWLAGMPDIADQTDSSTLVNPACATAVNRFVNDLMNKGGTLASGNTISIRSVDRSGANPVVACTAWDLIANTYTVPGNDFVPGQPLVAEGMTTIKGGFAPRGRYLVKTKLVDVISLQGAGTPTAPVKTGGFRKAIFTFSPVTNATQMGFTKRNKGRPSFLSVGRRRSPLTRRA